MKSKKYKSILSAIALLLVLVIAPVSSGAYAQTTTDAEEPDTQTTVDDTGISTDIETGDATDVNDEDSDVNNEETDESDVNNEETDESDVNDTDEANPETDVREDIRKDYRDDRKEIRDQHKDQRKDLRDQFRDERKDLREQYKDRLKNSDISVVRPVPIDPDRSPDVTFNGGTSGYMILGGQAWHSEIALDGSAYHVHNGMWKVLSSGKISVAGISAELDLKGFAKGNKITLHGSGTMDNGDKIRLVLRGHFAPTPEYGVFAMAFTNAKVHNINTGERIPLMHVGEVIVTPTGVTDIEPTAEPMPFALS